MAALVEWNVVGQIFAESLGVGIVIVGAFAVGARLVAAAGNGHASGRNRVPALGAAAVCFLIAAVAVGYGVYFTVDK